MFTRAALEFWSILSVGGGQFQGLPCYNENQFSEVMAFLFLIYAPIVTPRQIYCYTSDSLINVLVPGAPASKSKMHSSELYFLSRDANSCVTIYDNKIKMLALINLYQDKRM